MALKVRAYGARRCLRDGFVAAREGKINEALLAMRAYFGLRERSPFITPPDADAAVLAATCAALRGDETELAAVVALLGDEQGPHVRTARAWIDTLERALAGDVARVAADVGTGPDAIPRELAPALILLAAERGRGALDAAAEGALRAGQDGASSSVRARVVTVLASAALAKGDRAAALAELDAMPADAPPLHAF